MSTVVNSNVILNQFKALGWTNGVNELLDAVLGAGKPASVFSLYLAALITTPTGLLDDQAISGVTPAQGTAITSFLRAKGLVGT
jgi:hypothetical protein